MPAPPTGDFPAAHSMDTEWFAIDADGHVAVLESSEDGEVPEAFIEAFHVQTDFSDLTDHLEDPWTSRLEGSTVLEGAGGGSAEALRAHYLQRWERYRDNLTWLGRAKARIHGWLRRLSPQRFSPDGPPGRPRVPRFYRLERALLALESPETIPRLKAKDAVIFKGDPTVVYVDECPLQKAYDLLEDGRILAYRAVTPEEVPGFFGVHRFAFDDESDDAPPGTYKRLSTLRQPLHVDDLPEALRPLVEAVRFESLRFADTPTLRPSDHVPCKRWGA